MHIQKKGLDSLFIIIINIIALIGIYLVGISLPDESEWFYFVLVIIIVAIIQFLFFRQIYNKRVKAVVDKINYTLTLLTKNEHMDLNKIFYDNDLSSFHDTLSILEKWIEAKESNYREILELFNSVALNMDLEKMLESMLPKLLDVTESSCGAFYLTNYATNRLEIKSSIGFSKNIYSEFDLHIGEGFIGTALKENRVQVIKDIPEDTIYIIRTFLGKIQPKNILLVPVHNNENIVGILLFASIYEYTTAHLRTIEFIKSYVGVAISNGLTFERGQRLTNELKFQNKLIHELNDDLEKKVMERTSFLQNIINSIEDYAIYAMDNELILTAWNKGAEKILGYTAKEVIGQSAKELFSGNRKLIDELENRMRRLDTMGRANDQEWRQKKDGTAYFADISLFKMYNDEGNHIGYTCVNQDITALRKAEDARWFERSVTQKILESSQRALLVVSEEGQIELCNKNAGKILKEPLLVGKNLGDFFQEKELLLDQLKFVNKGNQITDWRFTRKDLETYVILRISGLQDEENRIQKLFVYLYTV